MAPVLSTEREGALQSEVKHQAGDEGNGSGNPEAHSEDFMHEGQQCKVHGERGASNQEELYQMAALNDKQDPGRQFTCSMP